MTTRVVHKAKCSARAKRKARRRRASRAYALKVMKKATYAKNRLSEHAFFERNLMLVARHTFLVRLRYAFQSRRDLYLVTDYFAGGSLEDALKRVEDRKGLGRDAARFIVAELSLGLDYLHARDVLHRGRAVPGLLGLRVAGAARPAQEQ